MSCMIYVEDAMYMLTFIRMYMYSSCVRIFPFSLHLISCKSMQPIYMYIYEYNEHVTVLTVDLHSFAIF